MTRQTTLAFICLFATLSKSLALTLFTSRFRESTEDFVYQDNAFRNTTQGFYASGNHNRNDNGYLEVTLGGINNRTINGISGGWVREFTLQNAAKVVITLDYNLAMKQTYEAEKFSQALCSVDGKLIGFNSSRDYVGQTFGGGNGINSFTRVTIRPGILKAGLHRLRIGAYNNKKDRNTESTLARFGYVRVDYIPIGSPVNMTTRTPMKAPVRPPIAAITLSPVKPPTKSQTTAPVNPPVTLPTNAPVLSPVKFPIIEPVAPTGSDLFEARINVGSANTYVDYSGTTWEADKYFDSKGYMFTKCPMDIAGSDDDALYCKERYFNIWETPQPYRYIIPVPRKGIFSVKLHFAEIVYSTKRERVFDVMVNGKLVVKQLDIVDKVGPNTALIIPVTTRTNGTSITIELIPIRGNPKISAIEVMELTTYVEPPTSAPVAQPFSLLINCGGTSFIEADGGRIWNADEYFIGGYPYSDGRGTIASTLDYSLYHSERNGEFQYEIPVPENGSYKVILHFAELYWQEFGQRLFNIYIENISKFVNVDIVALGNGVPLQAVKLESTVTVSDGYVSIKLLNSIPHMDIPKLSGIEILAK